MARAFRLELAVAAIAVGFAIPAQAQLIAPPAGPGGFYIGAQGGWTNLLASTVEGNGAVGRERFKAGFDAGGRAGYSWGPLRLEGEVSYRQNYTQSLQRLSPTPRPGLAAGAQRHVVSEMVNLIYDLHLDAPISPHFGGGIGAAQVTRNLTNKFGGVNDTATTLGYQAIAGIRYWINPVLAVDLDYRYFATTSATLISSSQDLIRSDYGTHNVVLSLILQLGGSPWP